MSSLTIYVEGGGTKAQFSECRRAFQKLFETLQIEPKPRVVASGSRYDALREFKLGIGSGERALLLVDSEGPVKVLSPWEHVRARRDDQWERPVGVNDDQLHLMVQAMEAWILADQENLEAFFGKGFRPAALPTTRLESVPVGELEAALKRASDTTSRGAYRKGLHSFTLLSNVDPRKLTTKSPWANRFFETVRQMVR